MRDVSCGKNADAVMCVCVEGVENVWVTTYGDGATWVSLLCGVVVSVTFSTSVALLCIDWVNAPTLLQARIYLLFHTLHPRVVRRIPQY